MCPRCNSEEISRSKQRKWGDWFMALWNMKPYRCRECRRRFYLPARLAKKVQQDRAWLRSVSAEPRSRSSRS